MATPVIVGVKITALPASSALNLTDLFEKVNDPGGTPENQGVTLQQFTDYFSTVFVTIESGRILGTDPDPNGVVTADQGTEYIDTDLKTRWVKLSAGNGNTGWQLF